MNKIYLTNNRESKIKAAYLDININAMIKIIEQSVIWKYIELNGGVMTEHFIFGKCYNVGNAETNYYHG